MAASEKIDRQVGTDQFVFPGAVIPGWTEPTDCRELPLSGVLLSFRTPYYGTDEWLEMAGRVKSPMAASEHSSSQNLDFADWPVSRNGTGRIGSSCIDLHDDPYA